MLVDAHLHLHKPYMQDDRLDAVIGHIEEHRIVTWVQSCDIETYEEVLNICNKSKYLFPCFGILPWYAHKVVDKHDLIAKLSREAIMLGEIGLDKTYAPDPVSHEHQLPVFEIFLREAERSNKIMSLHIRDNIRENLEIIQSYNIKKAVFHGYCGDGDVIKEVCDAGYYTSFQRGQKKERVLLVPDDLLLLEIDVLERDEPHLSKDILDQVLDHLSKIRKTAPDEIKAISHRNALRLVKDDPNLKDMVALLEE